MTSADKVDTEEISVQAEADDDEAAVAYDIASYPSDLTLSVVNEMWKRGDIVIPDYQRNYVWSIRQASLLIESFLLGLPVPQVFFYVDEENKNQVIDGQQRIVSIVSFMEGDFGTETIQGKKTVFRLHGLDPSGPFANKKFDDLEDAHQRKLRNAVLRAINIRQLNPKGEATSVYHIFERLNTGGTPLKPQEIRNCVFRGQLVKILRELNGDENWRAILGKQTLDRHQKDVELILRVFALSYFLAEYVKPMKEFLNRIMVREQHGTSATVTAFVTAFKVASAAIVTQLGRKPFHVRGPLNASVLDAVFAAVIGGGDHLPGDLKVRYAKLLTSVKFAESTSVSTSDASVLKERFDMTRKALLE